VSSHSIVFILYFELEMENILQIYTLLDNSPCNARDKLSNCFFRFCFFFFLKKNMKEENVDFLKILLHKTEAAEKKKKNYY
jgi:hypothetical protein